VIFSVDAVSYNMKTRDHLGKLGQVVTSLDSLQTVVVIPFVNRSVLPIFTDNIMQGFQG
jgi:hypothetical protein